MPHQIYLGILDIDLNIVFNVKDCKDLKKALHSLNEITLCSIDKSVIDAPSTIDDLISSYVTEYNEIVDRTTAKGLTPRSQMNLIHLTGATNLSKPVDSTVVVRVQNDEPLEYLHPLLHGIGNDALCRLRQDIFDTEKPGLILMIMGAMYAVLEQKLSRQVIVNQLFMSNFLTHPAGFSFHIRPFESFDQALNVNHW